MRAVAPSQKNANASVWLEGLADMPELRSIAEEEDPELFFEALLHYGARQERSNGFGQGDFAFVCNQKRRRFSGDL